MGIKTTIEP